MKLMAASAVAPCISHKSAMAHLAGGLGDPLLGPISIEQVQLCPQHSGKITRALLELLMDAYPDTNFRLHASPRVEGEHRHAILTAANCMEHDRAQLESMIALNKQMGSHGYSIHAGKRSQGTLASAFDNVRRLADMFGCRVGIEGLYPAFSREEPWLLSCWDEYEEMLESGIDYALDLSHLYILGAKTNEIRLDLVEDLIKSPQCMEIHVSANDGKRDEHYPLKPNAREWWLPLLGSANTSATVFYEGALVLPKIR